MWCRWCPAWLVGATVGAALTERTGCDAAVKVGVDVPARVVGEAGDGPDPDFESGGHPDVGSGPAFVDPDEVAKFEISEDSRRQLDVGFEGQGGPHL